MERDFSENMRQKMISMVSEIENDKWNDITDFIGDRWYDFESWIGLLNIKHYLNDVSSYHKKIIDRKNYSVNEINTIFDEVNQISDKYSLRMSALLTCLEKYKQTIRYLCETISPENRCFNAEHISLSLKQTIDEYNNSANIIEKLINEGYDEKDFESIDSKAFQETFSQIIDEWISILPNGEVEKQIEIPVGPNLVLYYVVSIEGDIGSGVSVETVADENKLKFQNFKISGFNSNAKVDYNGIQEITHDFDSHEISVTRDGVELSVRIFEERDTTYTTTYKLNVKEFIFEEEVSTKVDGGEVKNKIGIRKENKGLPLKPITAPVENKGTLWDLIQIMIPVSDNNMIANPLGFVNEIRKLVRELSANNHSSSDLSSIGLGIGGAGISSWLYSILVPCLVI